MLGTSWPALCPLGTVQSSFWLRRLQHTWVSNLDPSDHIVGAWQYLQLTERRMEEGTRRESKPRVTSEHAQDAALASVFLTCV